MDEQPKQQDNPIRLERIFGIILLTPPLIGVILFLINLLSEDAGNIPKLKNLSSDWTGSYDTGGYTSAAPIYLGLLAIAGAWLLKGTDRKQNL